MQPCADNATHTLQCHHCIGRVRKNYRMRCHVLKTLPDGRIKVLVFGDRDWNHSQDKSRVRYVEAWRVVAIR